MNNNKFLLSIIIPCYNEADNIFLLVNNIEEVLTQYHYEIILVNDGSTDSTVQVIELISQENKHVKYIHFSRNFGHQAAIKAGVDFVKGDCIVTMDADLQHPPETIPDMIKAWQNGFDVVTAIRNNIHKRFSLKNISSICFYWLLSKLADQKVIVNGADFRLFDKKIGAVIRNMPEQHMYLRGLFSWVGFKQTSIDYTENQRAFGKTKYSAKKMFQLASHGITAFSIKPLRISLAIGVLFALLAFSYGIYALIIMLLGAAVSGWTSIIASILFLAGIQLMVLGVMGEYIGKLYIQNKQRPHYLITATNIEENIKVLTKPTERRAVVS
ncbi:glycosyltransferase family 2 protein [Flavivirga aquimarina]|uniref:Glycosyltransferase family 2 protein n=1 Tax=Flavivirga aquimarina TaxID=2027862 RepID=A0ABT8WCJ4_9FLAO|nr:glycosyltransferase family 2 protein [Flavivirga aquimarina]MDO5970764.1 glycosyltransferase family 2 protein [Flavivirga aquimarina]